MEQVNVSNVTSPKALHPVGSVQQVRISGTQRLRSHVYSRSLKMVAGADSVVEYEPKGLTQGQMIGIGVGFGAGGAFCIMALVAVWERRHVRMSRAAEKLEADNAQRKAQLLAIASTLKEAEKHNAEDSEGGMQGILLIPTPRKDIDLSSTESGAKGDSTESKNARTPVSSSAFAMTPRSPVSLRNSLIVPCVVTTTPTVTAGQANPTPRDSLVAYLAAQSATHDTLSHGSQSPMGKANDHAIWTLTMTDSRTGGVNVEPSSAKASRGYALPKELTNDPSLTHTSIQSERQMRIDHSVQRDQNDVVEEEDKISPRVPLRLPIRRAGANEGAESPLSNDTPSEHRHGGSDARARISAEAEPTSARGPTFAKHEIPFIEVAATQEISGSNSKTSTHSAGSVGMLGMVAAPKVASQKKSTPANGGPKGGYTLYRQGGGTPARSLEKISLTELVANSQATPSPRTEAELTYRARLISEAVKERKVEALAEYVKNVTTSTSANK